MSTEKLLVATENPTNTAFESLCIKIYTFLINLMPDWEREYMTSLEEQNKLVCRNSKYETITSALKILSIFKPFQFRRFISNVKPLGYAPSLFTSYFFCRIVDDFADGDEPLPPEFDSFEDFVKQLTEQIHKNEYDKSTNVSILLRGTIRDTLDYGHIDIKKDVIEFLEAMLEEHNRRVNKEVSSRDELYNLYQKSFGVPQDIALIGVNSKIRSTDIPELADLQGRIYAVRDLMDELPRGIIFIPKEIVENSGIKKDDLIKKPSLIDDNAVIQQWIKYELNEGMLLLQKLNSAKLDWKAKIIVRFLTTTIKTIIKTQQTLIFSANDL